MNSTSNQLFSLASDIVLNTSQSVFLTGKAGTGKTTFLRHIQKTANKNVIVAAPTGVAAINAGGVTLHSLLQLPFEPFTPDMEGKEKLDYHFKLRRSKIQMLKELDLLIIDEVSMLRADMLDAIDHMLKRYRNNQQVFGGVQMLFIGDLFQLPPVVQNHEWSLLNKYYASPFFFHAHALNDNMPLYIELKEIYRQTDEQFIEILNRIRNNEVTQQDLQLLNAKYSPTFHPKPEDKYVTLCTHNYRADQINKSQLERLTTKSYSFKGAVKGNFADNALPTEINLVLKLGAQIMFVKNDSGEKRRYYNGKLATIISLSEKKISVEFEDGSVMELEKEIWRNVRYVLNEDFGEIEEQELGHFSQYPVRLAWAITIHKSQGLTFERVIIDAGQAFAAGQVYVALSRCTTLDGIVLYSKITQESIQTDSEALRFAKAEQPLGELEKILEMEKPVYTAQRLKMNFDWQALLRCTRAFYELVQNKETSKQEKTHGMAYTLYLQAKAQDDVAKAFIRELDSILDYQQNMAALKERVCKASQYFHKEVLENIAQPLAKHLDELKKASHTKLYLRRVKEVYTTVENFLEKLENVHYGNVNLTEGLHYEKVKFEIEPEAKQTKEETAQKGSSQRLTLSLFREGKSVAEISKERNLKPITIEGHLADFILTEEVKASELIPQATIDYLTPLLQQYALQSALKPIKDKLPAKYSYFDIKVVLRYLETVRS